MTRRAIPFLLLLLSLGIPMASRTQDVDFSDEPAEIEGTPENAERIANFLRIADNSIMDYVTRSTGSIAQGHRHGFADFRDWYRTRRAEEAEREATEAFLVSLIGNALGASMNLVFPGSSTFLTVLKEVSMAAYNTAASAVEGMSEAELNLFLDRHERALEGVLTELLEVPEQFRRRAGDELEAAKWEFVFEAMDRDASSGASPSSEVGPRTRRLLRNMGIPAPGAATAGVYRIRILTQQIYGVFSQDRNLRTSWSERDMRIGARAAALRHVYPNQPNRYCPEETQLHNFFWSEECRRWNAE